MSACTVHIVPHAHWDREWYMPFELHRARLVENLDRVLALLERDSAMRYHLDGQLIALEDYLQIRPEKRRTIEDMVRAGRLEIGPWYVLQDEYLTSGEANVRNLVQGIRLGAGYGPVSMIGYLPDAFGNVGQMPQLFCQAGLKAAVFGRGVTLTEPGEEADPAGHRPRGSEFLWESPDGSRIPAVFFQGWYANANEMPAEPAAAKAYWDERLAQAKKYACTEHLLFMNGGDHQPVQEDIALALETARALYPNVTFILSDMEQYADSVLRSLSAPLEIVPGELAGQETAGNNTLCNTASTRAPLKALNRQNEAALERLAEPLAAMAAMAGMSADRGLMDHAWRLLMQNHPHDSICGCSVDEVLRQAEERHRESIQLAGLLSEKAGRYLSRQIAAPGLAGGGAAFAVWNTSGWERTQTVEATVCVERVYGTNEARQQLQDREGRSYYLTDAAGQPVPCRIEDEGVRFGYELPDDRFRRPYFERRVKVAFQAAAVPAFGYRLYYLHEGTASGTGGSLVTGDGQMENPFVRVMIRPDGTFDLADKRTGRVWRGLGYYEDTGDAGDEYIFRETLGEPVLTRGTRPRILCQQDTPFRAAFAVVHEMRVPASADETLAEAVQQMQPRPLRQVGRSGETVSVPVRAVISLEADSPLVHFQTTVENRAKDHRLRVVFPTDLRTRDHVADSVFDVLTRPDVPGKAWTNPSRCMRMQCLAGAEDEAGGLAVLNRGNYEYEILPERKSLAVTLVRSVGEMGDWGVFPTPDAQCQGAVRAELAVLACPPDGLRRSACREAAQFQMDMPAFQVFEPEGSLPESGSFLSCAGDRLVFTALKTADDGQGYVLRLFNASDEPSELRMDPRAGYAYWRSDILEAKRTPLQPDDSGAIRVPVRGKEILTVRFGEP